MKCDWQLQRPPSRALPLRQSTVRTVGWQHVALRNRRAAKPSNRQTGRSFAPLDSARFSPDSYIRGAERPAGLRERELRRTFYQMKKLRASTQARRCGKPCMNLAKTVQFDPVSLPIPAWRVPVRSPGPLDAVKRFARARRSRLGGGSKIGRARRAQGHVKAAPKLIRGRFAFRFSWNG